MPAIKISGITNTDDAKWAAILGVEYVSVCMDASSDKKVSLQKAIEIRNMLPSYSRFVAELGDIRLVNRRELDKLNPGWIQVKPEAGTQISGIRPILEELGIPVVVEINADLIAGIEQEKYIFQLNLEEMPDNETLGRLVEVFDPEKLIIHADWVLGDIKKVCAVVQPLAWSVRSAIEKSPRKIDYPVMKKYIREISLW